MLRNFITSINYQKLIEMEANKVTGYVSKEEIRNKYRNPNTSSKRNKIIKIGKRR